MHPKTAERFERLRGAARPYGAFTAAQAKQHGIGRSVLNRYLASGLLLRYTFDRAVYRFEPPQDYESLVDASLVAGPEAVASHVTALQLHDLTDLVPDAEEFTLPRHRRSRRPPWPLRFYFVTTPLALDEIATVQGLRVTTPARSLVDVARTSGHIDQIELGIAQALERGAATEAEFRRALERSSLNKQQRSWFEAALAYVSAELASLQRS